MFFTPDHLYFCGLKTEMRLLRYAVQVLCVVKLDVLV